MKIGDTAHEATEETVDALARFVYQVSQGVEDLTGRATDAGQEAADNALAGLEDLASHAGKEAEGLTFGERVLAGAIALVRESVSEAAEKAKESREKGTVFVAPSAISSLYQCLRYLGYSEIEAKSLVVALMEDADPNSDEPGFKKSFVKKFIREHAHVFEDDDPAAEQHRKNAEKVIRIVEKSLPSAEEANLSERILAEDAIRIQLLRWGMEEGKISEVIDEITTAAGKFTDKIISKKAKEVLAEATIAVLVTHRLKSLPIAITVHAAIDALGPRVKAVFGVKEGK